MPWPAAEQQPHVPIAVAHVAMTLADRAEGQVLILDANLSNKYLSGKAQLKYADRRRSPCVIIQGSNERAAGKVQIKDLEAGKRAAEEIDSRDEWVASRPAQVEVDDSIEAIVAVVRSILS